MPDVVKKSWSVLIAPAQQGIPVFKKVSLQEHIHYCLKTFIFFNKGAHPYFPDLGTTFYELLYRPFVNEKMNTFIESIYRCITIFEPRISQVSIICKSDPFIKDLFFIQLTYFIIELQQEDFLQLPFSTRDFYAYL